MKCKCGCEDFYIEKHGNNTGLYCKSCGKWQKWLNKDEVRLYGHQSKEYNNTLAYDYDDSNLRTNIEELIRMLDKEIDKQFEREPLSIEDNIIKCTYATAYEKVKLALENIL